MIRTKPIADVLTTIRFALDAPSPQEIAVAIPAEVIAVRRG